MPLSSLQGIGRFNEAAGIHRRKRLSNDETAHAAWASMRPPEFTGGNCLAVLARHYSPNSRFNEAAGIHRRKLARFFRPADEGYHRFNEAAGIHRRKPDLECWTASDARAASMRPPEFTGGNGPHPTLGDSAIYSLGCERLGARPVEVEVKAPSGIHYAR